MQRDFWFHCLRVGLFRPSHSCLQFNEIVLMWLHQLNLLFTVSSRVQPPASNDESRSLRNMVHQLIDVCRANQSHLTGLREEVATLRSLVNTLVARHLQPIPQPTSIRRLLVLCQKFLRVLCQKFLRGEPDWTPAPYLPPRRLFCSSSESLSCAVLSRSLHQPKMQCSCTTNQITGETLPLPRVSGHGPHSVLCTSLRGQVAHLQVATLLQVQDVWWDAVQFIAPTLSAVHTDPPGLHE